MDKEQAKFLLSSFRPDGADASLPEFAEALRHAAEDRELGEWLAQERAEDAAFAKALNEVPIPNGLREEILAVLEHDGRPSDVDVEIDSVFTGGLASIQPPEGLRDQILAAMDMEVASQSASKVESDKVVDIKVGRWLSVAAVAAAVAVVSYISFVSPTGSANDSGAIVQKDLIEKPDASQPKALIGDTSIQPVAVHNAVSQMTAKLKQLEKLDLNKDLNCPHDAISYLNTKEHPVPENLPDGLIDADLMGARDMYLKDGQPISLLCFKKEGMGMVHLIVLDTKNIENPEALKTLETVSLKDCYGCGMTKFNIAHWKEGDTAYMMLTKAKKQDMVNLF